MMPGTEVVVCQSVLIVTGAVVVAPYAVSLVKWAQGSTQEIRNKLGFVVMIPVLLYSLTTVQVILPQTAALLAFLRTLVLSCWLWLAYSLTEILVYYESLL